MRTLYTIGHSTRTIDEFIALLRSCNITQLVDIRTIAKSRHNPQFAQDELRQSLHQAGIEYVYMKQLGGLRPAVKHSTNGAWRNTSFRNYADYMQTEEFAQGVTELAERAKQSTTAIMCAEAVPWRCHRSLVADALVVRDIPVCEIISSTSIREHNLTSFALVRGWQVTYPPAALEKQDVS